MKICQFSVNPPLLCTSPVPVLKMNTVALHIPCTPSSYQDIQVPSSFNWPFRSLENFPTVSFQNFTVLTPFFHPRAKHQLKPPLCPWLPGFVEKGHNTTFSLSSPPALCSLAVLFLRNLTAVLLLLSPPIQYHIPAPFSSLVSERTESVLIIIGPNNSNFWTKLRGSSIRTSCQH